MRTDFSKFDEERVPTPDIFQLLDALVPRMSHIDFVGEIYKEAKALRERLEKTEDDTERETINKKLVRFKVTERQKYVVVAEKTLDLAEGMGYGFVKYNEAIYFYNGKRGEFGMKAFFYPAYPLMLLIFWAMVYFANR